MSDEDTTAILDAEAVPAVAEGDDTGVDPSDIQGVPGTSLDDYQPYDALTEDEKDEAFEHVFAFADPEMSERTLRVGWPGDEYDRNVEFSRAMIEAIPGSLDAMRVLEVVGIADHPHLIKWLAAAGRLMAGVSGDPTTIPQLRDSNMTTQSQDAYDDEIDALRAKAAAASAVGDYEKANKFSERERRLIAHRHGDEVIGPGGPIIGPGGRAV